MVYSASGFGYAISALFSDGDTAVSMAPLIQMPMVAFAGFFSNSGKLPVWISWVQYLSPIRYGLEGIITNEFDPENTGLEDFLIFLGYKLGLWKCLLILAFMTIFLRFLALIFLKFLVKRFQ